MKEEIIIQKQPTHATLSVILVDSNFPLSESQHNRIKDILEFSDIMFVFLKNTNKINKNKFTSLYEANGWIEAKTNIPETYLITLLYSLEIFEKHIGFCLINASDLENIGGNYSENITSITASSIESPIFKIKRLGTNEFYEIYKSKNSGIFGEHSSIENMYCSYTSESKILYLKRSIAGLIIDFWKSSEDNKFVRSFTKQDPRYFFASIIKYLGISYIDSEISDLDIGKL